MTENRIDFINDKEKMADLPLMTKDEFLDSYSYLIEEEYDATVKALKESNT